MASETRSGHDAPLLGTLLERRYRVDALLARGGMSTVYRGLDTRLDRPVAIKVMDSQYSGDRSFVERFEREARAAARLHHPNIVAVYDQGVDHDQASEHVFLIMQLVPGCTLRDLIRQQGRLSLPVAMSVLEPVLSALAAAHQAGMVHRDVKPENVLIGNDGTVRVADFGLVRAAASTGVTSGSVILGTVAYLSPEQVTTGAADSRSDVYAAGIVLYEMLTGEPPYVADNALSVAYRHVNEDIPAPGERAPELPPAVDDLVVRATRRDASTRPADAEAFFADLRRIRTQLGIEPVAVPIVADAEPTERMAPATGDAPSTEQSGERDAGVAGAHAQEGPRGTQALARPGPQQADDDTQEFAAVGARQQRARGTGHRRTLLWTLVIVLLTGLIGAGAFWLGAGRYVDVPPVVGEQEPEATATLENAGLNPNVSREHHDEIPENVVISTAPGPGSQVQDGDDIEIIVSRGKPEVPEISPGTSVADAENALRDAKLQPRTDESANRHHESVPEGAVIAIDPAPGTRLSTSSEVTLVVSEGPPPVPVPDLRGANKEQAFAALEDAGLEPYEAGREFDSDVQGDHVIRTEPEAGTEVPGAGPERVGVVVSNAVPVPNFNGSSLEEAQQQAADARLRLEVRSFLERPDAVILGQSPRPGANIEPGSSVRVNAL